MTILFDTPNLHSIPHTDNRYGEKGGPQDRRDAEYRQAWAEMSTARKAVLARHGITDPIDTEERSQRTGRDDDAATTGASSIRFSITPDIAKEVDSIVDNLQEHFNVSRATAEGIAAWHKEQVEERAVEAKSEVVGRLVGFLMMKGNIKVRIHALAHASRTNGMVVVGDGRLTSMRHSARILKVSAEHIRKVALVWVERCGFPPLAGAKSAEACEKYSKDKLDNHWRSQKIQ